MGVKSKANTTKTMKTRTETNLWSNVYWNQKKSEDKNDSSQSSCSSSNSYNSPFNNPNITNGAFGSRGFNNQQYPSGPSSLPLARSPNSNNNYNIYDCDMEKSSLSNVNSGPNSMILFGHQSNNNNNNNGVTSAKMSNASSVSSQAWGEMLDSAILDELTSMRKGSFSSLTIF